LGVIRKQCDLTMVSKVISLIEWNGNGQLMIEETTVIERAHPFVEVLFKERIVHDY